MWKISSNADFSATPRFENPTASALAQEPGNSATPWFENPTASELAQEPSAINRLTDLPRSDGDKSGNDGTCFLRLYPGDLMPVCKIDRGTFCGICHDNFQFHEGKITCAWTYGNTRIGNNNDGCPCRTMICDSCAMRYDETCNTVDKCIVCRQDANVITRGIMSLKS